MSTQFRISISGLKKTLRALSNVGRLPTPTIAQVLRTGTIGRFGSSTAPDGTAWKPSKPRKNKRGTKPLVDSGVLRSTITASSTSDSATVGSNLVYAAIHHYGGNDTLKGGLRFIPARPYLGISETDKDRIQELVTTSFRSQLNLA